MGRTSIWEVERAKMAESKVIILTGASRGIGLAIAHYLLKQSHKLVVVSRSEGPLRELEKTYTGNVAVCAGDLADFDLGQKAVDLAQKQFKKLDGLIINHVMAKLVLNPPKELNGKFL